MPCVVLRGLGVLLPRTRSFRRFRRFRPPAVVVQRRTSARPTLRANASLLDHSTISLAVHACVGTALLATLGISLLTSRDDTRLATASSPPEDTFETSVRWSVMTVLSFFPYFNFASWAFAAIDAGGLMAVNSDRDTNDQSYFWLLSILYFVPYIVDGFQLDTFTLFTIALGALHVCVGYSFGQWKLWFLPLELPKSPHSITVFLFLQANRTAQIL